MINKSFCHHVCSAVSVFELFQLCSAKCSVHNVYSIFIYFEQPVVLQHIFVRIRLLSRVTLFIKVGTTRHTLFNCRRSIHLWNSKVFLMNLKPLKIKETNGDCPIQHAVKKLQLNYCVPHFFLVFHVNLVFL
jgi:hypothetical protein